MDFNGEKRLLGLAFHPNYSQNRRFFLNYDRVLKWRDAVKWCRRQTGQANTATSAQTERIWYWLRRKSPPELTGPAWPFDSDSAITCEVRDTARAAIAPPNEPQYAPVWRYLFTHRVENDPNLKSFRAYHTEELFFLFGHLEQLGSPYMPSADELQLSNLVMDYWTRFAAKGDPNHPGTFHWPRYSAHDLILQLDVVPARLQGYHNP